MMKNHYIQSASRRDFGYANKEEVGSISEIQKVLEPIGSICKNRLFLCYLFVKIRQKDLLFC